MKMSTLYTVIAGFLYLTGFASIISSFSLFFPITTLTGYTLVFIIGWLFLAGCIILWGAGQAADQAFTYLNTLEHPQWCAQQRANEQYASLQELTTVEVNGRHYTLSAEKQIEAYSIAAEYVQCAGEQYELTEADWIYETQLRIQMGLPTLCY